MKVLWVTNDLPPRIGGIQEFVGALLERVHPDDTVVVGPADADAEDHDPTRPWRTVRLPAAVQPTPATLRRVVRVARSFRPDVVVLGASWPLGELAGSLRRQLQVPVVAISYGLEAGLVTVGLGGLVRRATRHVDAVTTLSAWTEQRLTPHLRAPRVRRLPAGVDVARFHPDVDGRPLRQRWEVPQDVPLVACISRLVPRKGQDALLEVWPQVRDRHPDAHLVLVGEGPDRERLARRAGPLRERGVRLPGRVSYDELPAAHAAADVFAMPCRTRWFGTDVEGLGIVYLEAQAVRRPAIAGSSGGAPEAVREGVTGSVVDGRDHRALLAALDRWLADPAARRAAGQAGRDWVERTWSWDVIATEFRDLLAEVVAGPPTRPGGA